VKSGGHAPGRRLTGVLLLSALTAGCVVHRGSATTPSGGQGAGTTTTTTMAQIPTTAAPSDLPVTTLAPLACPPKPTGAITSSSVTAPTDQDVLNGTNYSASATGTFNNPAGGISPVAMEIQIVVSYIAASTGTTTTVTITGAPTSVATGTYTTPGSTSAGFADGGLPNIQPESQPVVSSVLVGWDYLSPGLYHCDHNLPGELVPPGE
jgi:hypothetical protein